MCLAAGLALAGCSDGKGGTDTGGDTNTTQPVDTGTAFSQNDDARASAIKQRLDSGEKGDPVKGQAKYSADCALCHAPDGSGYVGFPSLVEKVPTLTPDQLVDIMMVGFPQAPGGTDMPPYATYSNQEIIDTIEYCEETFNPSR